jgi:hypothetical protein
LLLRAAMHVPALLLLPHWLLRLLPGALRRGLRLLGLGRALLCKARLLWPLTSLCLPAILVAKRPLLQRSLLVLRLLPVALPAGTGVACCCSSPDLLWRLLLPTILVLLLSPALAAASAALPATPLVLGSGWPVWDSHCPAFLILQICQ